MPINGKHIESLQLDFNAGSPEELSFRQPPVGSQIRRLILTTTADVYLAFDAAADDTCFVLTPGCSNIVVDNLTFTTISALGVTGTGKLYLLAQRS